MLFVYNRPEHVRRTVEALARNDLAANTDLWIFSDGPKDDGDAGRVGAVRSYLRTISGFQSVAICERAENFGLARSIIAGVTEVVNARSRAIVVEDDIVTSPGFLTYMNDALDRYADEEKVVSISGYCYPVAGPVPETFFLRGADCWGWATWRRGWNLFEPDGAKLLAALRERRLERAFDYNGAYPYTRMLRDQIAGKNDSWAIRWHASAFLRGKLTLYPGTSLVQNIGNDGSGTHGVNVKDTRGLSVAQTPVPVRAVPIIEDENVRRKVAAYFRAPNHFPARFALALFAALAAVACAARYYALSQMPSAEDGRLAPVRLMAAAVGNSVSELLVAAAVCLAVALLLSTLRSGFWRATVVGVSLMAALSMAALNITASMLVPSFGAPLTVGLVYYSDVLGSENGRLAVTSWLRTQDWLAIAVILSVTVVCAVLAWLATRRRSIPLLLPVVVVVILLSPVLSRAQRESAAFRRSPTLAFISSLEVLRGRPLFDEDAPTTSHPLGPEEPGIALDRSAAGAIRNVIVIVIESAGAGYFGTYGARYGATPRIDALASRSLTVEHAYAQAVSSSLSMGVMLSSRQPSLDLRHPLPDGVMLPRLFGQRGWRTAFFHSSDIRYGNVDKMLDQSGFAEVNDFRGRTCPQGSLEDTSEFHSQGTRDACTFTQMEEWITQPSTSPFFAMLWTFQTHYPYFPEEGGYLPDLGGELTENSFARNAKWRYLSALHEVDRLVGELTVFLDRSGLSDNTLIVVTGDHGEAFFQHGTLGHGVDLYEESVRVPLILVNPHLPGAVRTQRLTGHVDLAPTLTDLFGLETPADWTGNSLFRPRQARPVWFASPWIDLLVGYRFGTQKVIGRLLRDEAAGYDLSRDSGETTDLLAGRPEERAQTLRQLRGWVRQPH